MRRVARVCVPFALLALVVVAFAVTVRVGAPSDARAGEPTPPVSSGPLVTAILDDHGQTPTGSRPDGATAPTPLDGPGEAPSAVSGAGERGVAENGPARGSLEMHNLSVYDSPDDSPYVYVSFMPVSMETFFNESSFRRAVVEGEEVDVADVAPTLDEDHVDVELDGEPVQVSSLRWYYAGYGDLGGSDMKYMPICLIRIDRPDLSEGAHSVLIRIQDIATGATGEGVTGFTCGTTSGEL
jgi:hypothetical protein